MQEIAERITKVIKDKAKTKTEFAEKLNISQSFVSRLASGEKEPSDRTIADICREFSVNEKWLRTGQGDPYVQLSRDEELAAFFGNVLKGDDPDFRRRLLSVLSRLSTEEWELLEKMAWKLVDELRPEPDEDTKKAGPPE